MIYKRTETKKKAFTLTEVLIAVSIVGVIAALVLPSVLSNYQNSVFEHIKNRQKQVILDAIEALPVLENKEQFKDTMLYSETGAADDNSGEFMKKYLRVAKYCGVVSGVTDCFPKEYYEYSDKDKKTHPQSDLNLEGTCAQLKNGVSICMTPQIVGTPVKIFMDVNGPKGPNIIGRDIVEGFNLEVQSTSMIDRTSSGTVHSESAEPVTPLPENQCANMVVDSSNACCLYKKENNLIKKGDICCTNPLTSSVAQCISTVQVHVNYYPTTSSYSSGAIPYMEGSSNSYLEPSEAKDSFPTDLSIAIRCGNGDYQGGTLSGSSYISGIKNKQKVNFSGTINSSTCAFNNETLVWSQNYSTSITRNGVTYVLNKH